MKRKQRPDGRSYAASAIGMLLVGMVGLLLLREYPFSGGAICAAAAVALTGLALRWRKRVVRRRRLHAPTMRI